jgi:hypothetical protein
MLRRDVGGHYLTVENGEKNGSLVEKPVKRKRSGGTNYRKVEMRIEDTQEVPVDAIRN